MYTPMYTRRQAPGGLHADTFYSGCRRDTSEADLKKAMRVGLGWAGRARDGISGFKRRLVLAVRHKHTQHNG
jgi:hypothetical protein